MFSGKKKPDLYGQVAKTANTRENVRPDVTKYKVMLAGTLIVTSLKHLYKHSRLLNLQLILEGGLGLSGGQRQALVLSRLLVRQPQVLLLDEPTASLDDMTERKLLDNLERFCQGRTLVIATHRLSVLQRVDRILVLDAGRIVIDDARDAALAKLQGAQA